MKIAGVVVLYNPKSNVIDNIKSYLSSLDKLYIIDNSESKNDEFKNISKKVEYIFLGKNMGIAYALNCAAKKAYKNKYKWLLTMDQDSAFLKNHFKKMCLYLDELSNNKKINGLLNFDKIGIMSGIQRTLYNENSVIKTVSFPVTVMCSGNLINLEIFNKVGGFNENYFIDCVDLEYCLRLRKNGYEIIQLPSVELKHNLGNIKKVRFLWKTVYVTHHNYIRRYYITRNRHYLYDKYKCDFNSFCSFILKENRRELIKILLYEKDKMRKIKAFYQGYRDYKKGITGKYIK